MKRIRFDGHDWRGGLIIFVACVLVLGVLGGFLANKAAGVTGAQRSVACDAETACSATVARPREGVRKFKRNRLGRAPSRVRYSRHNKRVIVDELMAAQRRHNNRPNARVMSLGRAQMWRKFTSTDNCVWAWRSSGGSGSGQQQYYTCGKYVSIMSSDHYWTRRQVRGGLCGGLAVIGVGGAIATGATGPWTWVGIGAGFAYCTWGDMIEKSLSGP